MDTGSPASKPISLTRIVWIVLVVLAVAIVVVLVLANRHLTHVNLILWTVETRVFLLIPTVFILGFLCGYGVKALLGAGRRKLGSD